MTKKQTARLAVQRKELPARHFLPNYSVDNIPVGTQTSYGKTGLSPEARRRLAFSTVR